ncbi:FDLD family class I lanthipeptide [Streptomyces sp. NPDC006393]
MINDAFDLDVQISTPETDEAMDSEQGGRTAYTVYHCSLAGCVTE